MTALGFEVTGARADPHAAVPTINIALAIDATGDESVHAVALRCQIRIEPQRRRYTQEEEDRLYELFGETPNWGNSLRPFLWTHVSTTVPGFVSSTQVDLPVACTYDFEVAAAKYLHALEGGDVPLVLLFSGTVFTPGTTGFAAQPIPWDAEATFRLPVSIWRDVMNLYFPNSGWVRVGRETLDRLQDYKARRALATWDQAFDHLLKHAEEDP